MSAASAPSRATVKSAASGIDQAAVEIANTTSPSKGAWIGRIARARPSWAMIATRRAWAGVSATSVATQAMVVFRAWDGVLARPQSSAVATRPAGPSPPNSPPISNGAAQKVRPPGAVTEPQLFTATIVVVKIAALPMFGRLIARTGVRRVLTTCALAISPIPLMWAASSVFWWLLVIQLYAGVAWAGFELGMLMTLFDAADDAERTTIQSAFTAVQAIGTAGAGFIGGAILGAQGGGHMAYTWLFVVSAFARLAAAALVVRQLPRVIVFIPFALASRAWTMAIRPWGGTIIRAIAGARDE